MIVIYFILGLLLGSFYNVCIYRLPVGKSVVTPRSSCGACGHVLGGLDMIPVLSYFIFGRKCRHCGASYSARYALVELLTGALFAITYVVFGYTWMSLVGIILSSIVIIVTFIDIDHHIILDRFTVFGIILAIGYHLFISDVSWLNVLLGFLIGGGILFIIAMIGTMGGGDIKIMSAFGMLLGFPKVFMAYYLSFVIGAIVLLPIVIYQKKKYGEYKSLVPFGPFLCIGTWVTFYFGDVLYNFYLSVLL
ncbi:prepilin peptidase [Acidaminobacter sp. JC074]|uniref:prepilin peptidase n=1 Tax=Acidaminobacter sp. JC074 TaxID=2530199 RepID=UPI001F117304|nr:A24 family peptidase [Acidaminobacter sp. JC074]MCH4888800.1 prepilin peptidase [Acidaminobacter sp. JC074]